MIIADIDPTAQRQSLTEDVEQFDAALLALRTGNDEVLPPNEAAEQVLQEVSAAWQSFNATLTALLGSNYNATTLVPALATQNLVVYDKLDKLSNLYVNAAAVANGPSSGEDNERTLDLLQRQSGLIYKVWKETFLVSHGLSYSQLLDTKELFTSTHRGIIDGARWLDIAKLSEVCALRAMADVTYYSDQQSHLLLTIAASGDAPRVAAQLGRNVSEISKSLSKAMSIATNMFLDPTCSTPQLTDLEWFHALTNAEDQLLQASKATTLFLQIASNYNVAESKVQLTLLADDATLSLRHLLEGNKATGLVSPPSQELADQIVAVKGIWQSMMDEFTKAIFESSVSISSVSEVVRLTKLFTDGISEAVSLYVQTAISAGTSIPAYTIDLASRQRTKAQNLVKKAIMVNLGYSIQENWAAFNATNALLMETHWMLLEGAAAKAPYPAVNATTDLCIIQQMWTALGVFDQLQAATDRVLRGEKSLSQLATYSEQFDVEMGVAVEWYKSPGSASCDTFIPTLDQWKGMILEVGRIRSLSQELSSAYLLVELNTSTPEALLEGRGALDISVKRLRFGSPLVPAPPVQYVLDRLVVDVLPAVDAFHEALEGEDLATIFNQSSAVLHEADDFLETFFVEGGANAVGAPLYRMQLASRQIMLVQSIFRDYVLLSGNATAQTSMTETMANFEAVHRALREGGKGVAKLSLVRQDALKQWDRIGAVWGTFRQQVLVIPGALSDRASMLGSVQATLTSLVAELEVGVQLFGIQDEEMKGEYIWPIIAYSCFVVCMIGCIFAAIYAVKRYYRERAEWSSHAHDKV